MLTEFALVGMLLASRPKIYVDGYGWVRPNTVSHCLAEVGVAHTDMLSDRSWDAFCDCVTANGG